MSSLASLKYTSVPMATLLSVITLVLTGQPLTPLNVFMLVSFVLRVSTAVLLDNGLLETYDAYVSLGRIEQFLQLENLSAMSRDHVTDNPSNTEKNLTKTMAEALSHDQSEMEEGSVDELKVRNKHDFMRVQFDVSRKYAK